MDSQFEGLHVIMKRRRGQRWLRLRIKGDTIYVSAPWRASQVDMAEFLESKRDWVVKTLAKQRQRSRELLPTGSNGLPPVLYLGNALDVVIEIHPKLTSNIISFANDADRLTAQLPMGMEIDEIHIQLPEFIQKWLKKQAKSYLSQRAQQIALEKGFSFQRLYIRSQTTKWGTCSSKRNISLNWKLIQCPAWVIDYLIIHELCHLLEMNHGMAYWQWVSHHCPEYRDAEAWLKRYGSVVFGNY